MSDKALVKHLQKELARLESELRSPAPTSSTCDYVALLRKRDLQIQKREKEIRELTKQRDLAQSRVEDLLRMVGHDQEDTGQEAAINYHPHHQVSGASEDEYSVSESSGVADFIRRDKCVKKSNTTHFYDTDSGSNSEDLYHWENNKDLSLSDCASPPLSIGKKIIRSHSVKSLEENAVVTAEDSDEYYKEVQCTEMEELNGVKNLEYHALSNCENEKMLALTYEDGDVTGREMISAQVNGDREESQIQNGFTYGALERRLNNVQNTFESLVSPNPDGESSPRSLAADTLTSRSLMSARSWSCQANLLPSGFESTPPNGFEKDFPGRPESFPSNFPLVNYGANTSILSRNDSLSSLESAYIKTSADEDITSIHTFVAGLKKMAKIQAQETGLQANNFEKNVKDVGLDPMHEVSKTPQNWPLEFERQQREIFELWQTCNVSVVHRTYFFLLVRGDPSDSIYMGVELRRLSFLKERFSQGNMAVEDGRILSWASSERAIHRERETLSKLIHKRLTEEERNKLYQKWGIGLDSKRRKLQLVNQLWSNAKDIDHITESATIVAKLIRLVEQGNTFKEMFGPSFTPLTTTR